MSIRLQVEFVLAAPCGKNARAPKMAELSNGIKGKMS